MTHSSHKYNWRRTWKEFGKRRCVIDGYATWGWSSSGKFWKKKLSKYRRRAWKDEVLRGRTNPRGSGIEGECNWKGW